MAPSWFARHAHADMSQQSPSWPWQMSWGEISPGECESDCVVVVVCVCVCVCVCVMYRLESLQMSNFNGRYTTG